MDEVESEVTAFGVEHLSTQALGLVGSAAVKGQLDLLVDELGQRVQVSEEFATQIVANVGALGRIPFDLQLPRVVVAPWEAALVSMLLVMTLVVFQIRVVLVEAAVVSYSEALESNVHPAIFLEWLVQMQKRWYEVM